MNKYIVPAALLVVFAHFSVKAQTNRHIVFFTDKDTIAYNINEPELFLSERAIKRRAKQGISVSAKDFPVNQQYVTAISDLGATVFYKSKWFNAILVEADKETITAIEAEAFVEKTEFVAPGSKLINGKVKKASKKANFSKKAKYNQELTAVQNSMLGVNYMHQQGYRGEGMLIAVFDGGFVNVDKISYFDHLFINGQIKHTYDFVNHNEGVYEIDNGVGSDHGTGVLSCIGAYKADEFVGTAYKSDFILCITEDVPTEYRIEEYNWLFAAELADSAGADIINTSLGYSTFDTLSMNYTYEEMDGKTAVISRAASLAAETGMLIVVSAGNAGDKAWKYITAPADVEGLLAIAAADDMYEKVAFSSEGPTPDGRIKPDVAALGIFTSVVDGDGPIVKSAGTSFAAPLITGLTAGVWQANPELTYLEVIEHIKNSGHLASSPNNDLGYGVPHFQRVQGPILGTHEVAPRIFKVLPNPVKKDNFFIMADEKLTDKAIKIKMVDKNGKIVLQKEIDGIAPNKLLPVRTIPLQPGMYILHLTAQNVTENIKIVKF